MSHGILDSTSHVIATMFLMYRIAGTSFEPLTAVPLKAVMKEHQLRVCGSIDAATANLNDVWQEARGKKKAKLKASYLEIMEQFDGWRDNGSLPTKDYCHGLMVNYPSQGPFKVEAFRLDVVDAPQRRVNWSYRFVTEEL